MTGTDDVKFDAEAHWRKLLGDGPVARRILEDPGVDAAVRSGRPRKVHAALRKARFPPAGEEAQAIEAALRERRAFLEPGKPPSLYTLNGIGTRFTGRADVDPQDGTYVGTVFLAFLWIPIFPLSSWLVRPVPPNAWTFFGRVPFSRGHRVWRIVAPLVALAIALAIYSSYRHKATHGTMRLINGLDVAVTTTIDGRTVPLRAGGQQELAMRAGRFHLATRAADGETVEEMDVDVPGNTDVVLYNVLGAAPVYVERITYATDDAPQMEPDFELLAGESFLTRDDVEYVFREPAKQIQMHGKREVHTHVGVGEGGWRTSVTMLLGARRFNEASRIATRVVLLEKRAGDASLAVTASALVGPDKVAKFGKDLITRLPDSIDAHRVYQSAMIGAGRRDEVLAEYRARHEREPGSPTAGYLYTRILRAEDAEPILASLRKEHPDDPWLLRSAVWNLSSRGRIAEALPLLERLAGMPGQDDLLEFRARALVAAGRTPEAQRLVLDRPDGERTSDLLELYAKLRRLPDADGTLPADALPATTPPKDRNLARAELAADARDAEAFARGRSLLEPDAREAGEIQVLGATDPSAAALRAEKAKTVVLRRIDVLAKLTVGCELVRTGKEAAARRVFEDFPWAAIGPIRFESLRDPLAASDDELPDEWRAALLLAASRKVSDAGEREALIARARALDVLRCVVPP